MIFSKAINCTAFLSHKSNLICRRYASRFFGLRKQTVENRNYSSYKNAIFASTGAAFGISMYIIFKNYALCESLDIIENKEFKIVSDEIYDEAIRKSREILKRIKDECGAPGMVVGVSINGKNVWSEGFGYADIENRVLCTADTVMRIASISKSITMAAVGKLWEEGKLDLDKPIQTYVSDFPVKTFNGKPVTITCRHLVSHLSGIRHYQKTLNSASSKTGESKGNDSNAKKNEKSEFEEKEYFIKDHYKDVKSALSIFKDDPLLANPGSKYIYSTHGWTLISAVVEAASKEEFSMHMTKLFKSLGMHNTYLDVNDALIYHRSRNYVKDKKGFLINAPYVDNSYKWAGGGFLSTVGDLLQFGNAMLYSLQYKPMTQRIIDEKHTQKGEQNVKCIDDKTCNLEDGEDKISNKQLLPGYLKSKTVETMWTPVVDTKEGNKYGMGWGTIPEIRECQFCEYRKFCTFHTGGAIGASSVLLIMPQSANEINDLNEPFPPKGIVVSILTNLHAISLSKTALKIAQAFDDCDSKQL